MPSTPLHWLRNSTTGANCVTIAALVAASVGCSRVDQSPKQLPPTKVVASADDLAIALATVRDLKSDSYHHYLREASLLVSPTGVGQSWRTLTDAMDAAHFPAITSWDNGDAAHVHYLARKDAVQFGNGHSLDLQIMCSAVNDARPNLPAVPGKIFAADAALVDEIHVPYADLISQDRYPKGSVLDVVLHLDEVQTAGFEWPLVKQVAVHYGYLFDRWDEYSPCGFSVTVEFVASLDEEIGGKRIYITVASGLDPLRSFDGNEESRTGFTAQNTLGEIRTRGAGEWWCGEPDVIEANQKKYLKNRKSRVDRSEREPAR